MAVFDISPFALPNCALGEIRFEEPRDIREIRLAGSAVGADVRVSYLRNRWPEAMRSDTDRDRENPARFGWQPTDDWFNCSWQPAAVTLRQEGSKTVIEFEPLKKDGYRETRHDPEVVYRRTLGIRIEGVSPRTVTRAQVFTTSAAAITTLRVRLDAGKRTQTKTTEVETYNSGVRKLEGADGRTTRKRSFTVTVEHMIPAHRYAHDQALVTFVMDCDTFTVGLEDIRHDGGVWYAEQGVYVSTNTGPSFESYRESIKGQKTISARAAAMPEHSFAAAYHGQPRPHAVHAHLGCKHLRQRFLLEPNGDIVLDRKCVDPLDDLSAASAGYLNVGHARFFFGLESWINTARFTDPGPAPVFNIHAKRGDIEVQVKSACVPLTRPIPAPQVSCDEPTVALVRLRFQNTGETQQEARVDMQYSQDSGRSVNALSNPSAQDEHLVPMSPRDPISITGNTVTTQFRSRRVIRCIFTTAMSAHAKRETASFSRKLSAGERCELLLKIPFVSLETGRELAAVNGLAFDHCVSQVRKFWRSEVQTGSRISTPVPQLDSLHDSHLMHVQISDFTMPDDPEVINTSVGTSTYGNFSNESCMIVQELIQRGCYDDARKRLDLWVKYQSSKPQPGNFTDYDGMYFGAGGFEQGSYNQHHGWVLWCMAEYVLLTGDRQWCRRVADSMLAACDWVFRQRKTTRAPLEHSRGWEQGFLPAGSLEDVTEFSYWLSTNAVTWRGCDHAARALEAVDHPEARRVRREANAYARDLRRGFETSRQHSPLVRLRDGRWVPTYPSRIYCRGRDYGWIREVLEGSVYLLVSGLYKASSRNGGWILDDHHDNRYLGAPYGYVLRDPENLFISRGGFSIQPTLLAGLMPHLDRDEPEIYQWMLFNSLRACYREEIDGLSEHPMPELGFSNSAQFKTSDEANAMMWLRYLFVYSTPQLLHIGRAVPRRWLGAGKRIGVSKVTTYHGVVDAKYESRGDSITLRVKIKKPPFAAAPRFLARFRHAQGAPITGVTVNGKVWKRFDPRRNDVDLTGVSGSATVIATFRPAR